MRKNLILRAEYERIFKSWEYLWSGWRESYDQFKADLWDMTPTSGRSGRFLAPIEAELGFTPGNVEWHYPKVRKPKAANKVKVPTKARNGMSKKPKGLTAPQKRAAEKLRLKAEKQAKREALAAEFMRWERIRSA